MQLIKIMFIIKDISKIRSMLIKDIRNIIVKLIIYISKDISTTNDLILKQINKVFNNFETRHVKRIVLIKNDEIQAVYKKTSHT